MPLGRSPTLKLSNDLKTLEVDHGNVVGEQHTKTYVKRELFSGCLGGSVSFSQKRGGHSVRRDSCAAKRKNQQS